MDTSLKKQDTQPVSYTHLNLIEPLRSGTFEESIGLTFLTDTVYDVTAVMELIDHLFDHSHIILQIRIDGNRHIGQIHRRDQSGGQCELMSHIACQFHAAYLYRMRLMFFFDQLPCTILTSIINKQDKTCLLYTSPDCTK